MKYTPKILFIGILFSPLIIAQPAANETKNKDYSRLTSTLTIGGLGLLASGGIVMCYKIYQAWHKGSLARDFRKPLAAQQFKPSGNWNIALKKDTEAIHFVQTFVNKQTGLWGGTLYEGHAGSAAASLLNDTKKGLMSLFLDKRTTLDTPDALKAAFAEYNKRLLDKAETSGVMVVSAIIEGSTLYLAQLGTSKAFLIRDGEVITQTKPHIPHREKNFFLPAYCLGSFHPSIRNAQAVPDITVVDKLQCGDKLIIVSDNVVKSYTSWYEGTPFFENEQFINDVSAGTPSEIITKLIANKGFSESAAAIVFPIK